MFTLNSHDTVPLYKQLYNQLRDHLLSGKLAANTRLPSVRELAAELSISRNTVDGAYQELYAEGYLYSKPRSGYFAAALDQEAAPLSLLSSPGPPAAIPERPITCRYDFHPARLDPNSFPSVLWRRLYGETLADTSGELVQYGEPRGDLGLRLALRHYLERSRGVVCDTEQIVICSGLQQSLDIVALLLKGSHTRVALENPGYHLPRSLFRNHGYSIVPVPVGSGGLDLETLKAGNSTIVYVTPSHQLPMGCVMPVANRLKLLDWAESGGMIIEDDYDSELRYHGKPIPSLQGLRPLGNIIYSGTFSKILSPALRISYLVLPRSLLADYRRLFRDYFATVSLLEQRTLAKFMERGDWDRHVRRMRIVYQKKHDALISSVNRHFGSRALVVGQGAGLHLALQLSADGPDEAEIIHRAGEKGVSLFPLSAFYFEGKAEFTTILLGFGGMTSSDIDQGVALLSRVCY